MAGGASAITIEAARSMNAFFNLLSDFSLYPTFKMKGSAIPLIAVLFTLCTLVAPSSAVLFRVQGGERLSFCFIYTLSPRRAQDNGQPQTRPRANKGCLS